MNEKLNSPPVSIAIFIFTKVQALVNQKGFVH